MEFFRHCPQCGRRFHVKLVSKKLEHIDRESVRTKRVDITGGGTGILFSAAMPFLAVREGEPVIVDVEEFRYAYMCKHCGHEWFEKQVEEDKER